MEKALEISLLLVLYTWTYEYLPFYDTYCNYLTLAHNCKDIFRNDSLQICVPFSIIPSFISDGRNLHW